MKIEDIYDNKLISTRTYRICKKNSFDTVSDIRQHLEAYSTFENLPGCGKKSTEELMTIAQQYAQQYLPNTPSDKDEMSLRGKMLMLTKCQKEVVDYLILLKEKELSVRNRNALSHFLENDLSLTSMIQKRLLLAEFDVRQIKNVGSRYAFELENFLTNIKSFVLQIIEIEDEEELDILKNSFFIQHYFGLSSIPREVLEPRSIFVLIDYLLNQNVFFGKRQTTILKKALKIYENQEEMTLDDIAHQVQLSRERVRQVKKLCFEKLYKKLQFLTQLTDDLLKKYDIDFDVDFLKVDDEMTQKINHSDGTGFSKEFITYILYVYLSHRFSWVGNIEDVLAPRYFNTRNRHNWQYGYLLKKRWAKRIDFTALADDISRRVEERNKATYTLSFNNYLSSFITSNRRNTLKELRPICEKVIECEFGLRLENRKYLLFERNTYKQAYEYAYEALEALGKPSKVKDIFEKVQALYPDYDTEEVKIRVSMKQRNGFVPIGRKSVFGLKKWEKQLKNFRGGTIRSIVEEYLMFFDTPKHISEVAQYVLRYRPKSNQYSIHQNLKLEDSGMFVFYTGANVGLSSKKYPTEYIKLSAMERGQKRSWEERFEVFKKFLSENNRLPLSNRVPQDEIALYRWFNVQKNKHKRGKLANEKIEKIVQLLSHYPSLKGVLSYQK